MCLYPKLILNRKYLPNIKNGGQPPLIIDERTRYVAVGCGKCMECKKQKARAWSIRLQEEIKVNKTAQYVTLTFSNESIKHIIEQLSEYQLPFGYDLDNEIATWGVRHFLERWRKKHKKSVKHWLVTELGGNGTENIHLHGIIFSNNVKDIKNIWQYGYVYIGDYVNNKTIAYITKYIIKTDIKHKYYNQKILCSKGIGKNYINSYNAGLNKYKMKETSETYVTRQGYKLNLPIYYRNKIYTDYEKEQLWINILDKQIRYVNGIKIDISKGDEQYNKVLKQQQKLNKQYGYGDDEINWQQKRYEQQKRRMNQNKRINKNKNN